VYVTFTISARQDLSSLCVAGGATYPNGSNGAMSFADFNAASLSTTRPKDIPNGDVSDIACSMISVANILIYSTS
jgi:hypothetical protein